jgi:hypothetical protein
VALAYLHNMHWQIIIIIIWTSLGKLDIPEGEFRFIL